MEEFTKKFYDVRTGLKSKAEMRKQFPNLTKGEFDALFDQQQAAQIIKPVSKTYLPIIGYHDDYQVDVIFFDKYKNANHGYIGFMICVELTSRMMFNYAVKNKSITEMKRVMNEFLKNKIDNITTDEGVEFVNNTFKKLFKEHNITHWIKEPADKYSLGIVDRACRTIRDLITKYQIAYETYNWVDVLDDLTYNYNNRIHSSLLGHTPTEVFKSKKLQEEVRESLKDKEVEPRLDMADVKIGDKVRILINRGTFFKGRPKWSKQIYEVNGITKNSFTLKDHDGTFRVHQLQKVDSINIFKPTNEADDTLKQYHHDKVKKKIVKEIGDNPILEEKRVRKQTEHFKMHRKPTK